MHRNAELAYEQGGKVTGSGRELEAAALIKAARMLQACQKEWNHPDRRTRFSEALQANLRLWTFFQVQLSRPDSELPADLRRDLLRLSAFVDRRTIEAMAHPAPDRVQTLIDINRHVAQGLTSTPA
jgi:flagellar protein FlaF